jgi:type I restriction enzyme, S subunit
VTPNPKCWHQTELGKVAMFINGGAWKANEYAEKGIPVVRVTDCQSGTVDLSSCKYLPLSALDRYSAHELVEGDLIIATVGSHPTQPASVVGRPIVVPREAKGALLNQNAVCVRPKDDSLNKRFLTYLAKAPFFSQFIIGCARGSANQVRMAIGLLKQLPVNLPPLPTQHKIDAILSAYDDLIENNFRRIKILEEMAKAFYREWFVRFHFPGHQKVNMVDSPLGKIPEGWKVATLGDVLATLESGSRPKGGIDPEARGVPSIGAENIIGLGRYDYSKEKFVTREFFDNMNRGYVQSGDVLLYKDGAQIGRKSMFRDGFPHVECCINEHVFILRNNGRCSQNYLFFWLDQPEMTQNIINLNANAAQPGINQSGVRGLPILLPPGSLLEKAEQVLDPLSGALFNYAKRNNILRQTRDLLLPRLISGELDVSELDITIPEANA